MAKDYYGFEDVVKSEKGIFGDSCAGICEGSAMTEFSKAQPEPGPSGVLYKITCETCGQTSLLVTWPEIVCLKHGISPHFARVSNDIWGPAQFAPGEWAPQLTCRCNWPIPMSIPPGEVNALFNQGRMRQWIPEQLVQDIANRCAHVAQQRSGR